MVYVDTAPLGSWSPVSTSLGVSCAATPLQRGQYGKRGQGELLNEKPLQTLPQPADRVQHQQW